jgi:hypothetical protein
MTTILPEFARSNLDSIRRALEPEKKPLPKGTSVDFLLLFRLIAEILREFWNKIQRELERGIEGRKLSGLIKELEDLTTLWLDLLEPFYDPRNISTKQIEEDFPKEMSAIQSVYAEIIGIQKELVSLRKMIDMPPPTISLENLQTFEESKSNEAYETGDEILTRLQQGGDL